MNYEKFSSFRSATVLLFDNEVKRWRQRELNWTGLTARDCSEAAWSVKWMIWYSNYSHHFIGMLFLMTQPLKTSANIIYLQTACLLKGQNMERKFNLESSHHYDISTMKYSHSKSATPTYLNFPLVIPTLHYKYSHWLTSISARWSLFCVKRIVICLLMGRS